MLWTHRQLSFVGPCALPARLVRAFRTPKNIFIVLKYAVDQSRLTLIVIVFKAFQFIEHHFNVALPIEPRIGVFDGGVVQQYDGTCVVPMRRGAPRSEVEGEFLWIWAQAVFALAFVEDFYVVLVRCIVVPECGFIRYFKMGFDDLGNEFLQGVSDHE